MAACRGSASKWFFTREQLETSPSRCSGVEPDRELSYRQQAANLIQDMGQRLNVSQLTINTAIVYMHRFYMYHSFTKFHRNIISPTTLFLAAKVEEQPRKLEHVIKVAHACLNPQEPPLDTKSNAYLQQAQELVILETIVLQTLGFEITIEHPHTDVVKCSQLVRASKDLAQTSYFMATNRYPTSVQHPPCTGGYWDAVSLQNALRVGLEGGLVTPAPVAVRCIVRGIIVGTEGLNAQFCTSPPSACNTNLQSLPVSAFTWHVSGQTGRSQFPRMESPGGSMWTALLHLNFSMATQAAKKPKSDNQGSESSSLAGPSLTQDQSLMDAMPGISSNPSFSRTSTSLPGNSSSDLSLDSINTQGSSFPYSAPSDWPQDQAHSDQLTVKQLPPLSSMHPQRPENPTKHENKVSSGAKHQAATCPPPPAPTQKMSLDKYREKLADLAVQKRKEDQLKVETEASVAPTQTDHRKQLSQGLHNTSSPIKPKPHILGQDKCERASSLKLRLPVPFSSSEKGGSSKDELKMKLNVSSERHSSSDEGSAKSKHSSPLVSKEKHRDNMTHRHHNKHGHLHAHMHTGNGRSSIEATGSSGDGPSSASSSARKRVNPETSHNHHSKKNKSSKSGAGSCSRCSSQVDYGHRSTPVKLDRTAVESRVPEGAKRLQRYF
ncbi:hypothetical protein DNTS_016360 [Danionella cerebrum]|uniref:Cyclin-like domain-containing protein n=1 Tax=Danionella cerebrum TaxID=2873325 RepID=A0A553N1H0_9TELE|nr:hypothetical protein DNTS_016360 [Danionella translucida]